MLMVRASSVCAPTFTVVVVDEPMVIVPLEPVFRLMLFVDPLMAMVLPVPACRVSVPLVVLHVEELAAVTVRIPFAVIDPLPLLAREYVPVLWFKLPVTVVLLLRFIAVAFVVPMASAPEIESSKGVVIEVLARPVPLMRKLAVWSELFWFWM